MDGSRSVFHASIKDAADTEVLAIVVGTDFMFSDRPIGLIRWHGEYPFGDVLQNPLQLDELSKRDWILTPGRYTVTVDTEQETIMSNTSPGNYEFRMVPEPSAMGMLWLPGLAVVWLQRSRRA